MKPRGDGLEMRLWLALQLCHYYLHLYTFLRYLGDNYLRVPREAASTPPLFDIYIDDIISGCFSNSQKITSTRTLLNFYYIRPCTSSIISFQSHSITFWLDFFFLRKVHLFGDQLRHIVSCFHIFYMFYSRFYFLVTLNCLFRAVHAYSAKFSLLTNLTRVFTPFSLIVCHRHQRKLRSIVIMRSALLSREKCIIALIVLQIARYFYRVYYLSTINVFPLWSRILILLSFHTNNLFK